MIANTTFREVTFPDQIEDDGTFSAKSEEQQRNSALQLEAKKLKELYFKYRNAFRVYCGMETMSPTRGYDDRQIDVDGVKYPLWEANVKRIRKTGMSTNSYMNLIIYAAQTGRILFPYPNALTSAQTLRSMVEFRKQRAEQFRLGLELQKAEMGQLLRKYANETDQAKRVIYAIMAPMNGLTPLFRFLMVHELKGAVGTGARRAFFKEAAAQYMSDPDLYDAVWGSILPPRFCKKARDSE